MNNVQHFLLPVDDMERAKDFYEDVFHWPIHSSEGILNDDYHAAEAQSQKKEAINGGLVKRGKHELTHPTVVVDVLSIKETLDKVLSRGGEVILPPYPVGEHGQYAQFKDSENNIIGLWEPAK